MSRLRIAIIDDHKVMRAGLRLLVDSQADLEVVGEAGAISDIEPLIKQVHPDLILLDLNIAGGSSLPFVQQFSRSPSAPKILILSMHNDAAYVRAALSAGATGYVVKTISEQELLQAIRSVHQGKIVIDLDNTALTNSVFREATVGTRNMSLDDLSAREREVLMLLGRGHTNQAIAEQLDISAKTVATYRARIGEKLGLRTNADFVGFASQLGTTGHNS